jgi:hypothetical protein
MRMATAYSRAAATAATRVVEATDPISWEFAGFSQHGEDGIIDYQFLSRKPSPSGEGMKAFGLDAINGIRYTYRCPFGDHSLETCCCRLPGESPPRRKTTKEQGALPLR